MQALTLLIKPASGSCNMRCRYCFYADVTDIREVKTHGLMNLDTLELVVRRALEETQQLCTFAFQGGEPTLAGLEFFRELIRLEQRHNKHGVAVHHALQTNGLAIDEEWARFLAEHRFLTGISIDGEKSTHDLHRLDPAGKGTHSRGIRAARLLSRHGAEFNILSVVTRALASHPDRAYQFYKREGFRHIQFIPCLDGLEEEHGSHGYSLDAELYGTFLCRIFDLWYRDFTKGEYISIRTFDNYIQMLAGNPPENCAMMGTCTAYPLVEADGSVYPCDFYAVDEWLLGNVRDSSFEELLAGAAAQAFVRPSLQRHPLCRDCPYLFLCRGGCRRDREPVADGAPSLNCYCAGYRRFFAHALPRMREIAQRLPR